MKLSNLNVAITLHNPEHRVLEDPLASKAKGFSDGIRQTKRSLEEISEKFMIPPHLIGSIIDGISPDHYEIPPHCPIETESRIIRETIAHEGDESMTLFGYVRLSSEYGGDFWVNDWMSPDKVAHVRNGNISLFSLDEVTKFMESLSELLVMATSDGVAMDRQLQIVEATETMSIMFFERDFSCFEKTKWAEGIR